MPSATRGKYSAREYAKLSGQPVKEKKTKSSDSTAKYEKAYLKTLKPSKEETQAENTLNNLVQSEELGVKNVEKQAIPLTFIQGQSERIRQQATEQAVPLKLQLATLQARRQATSEVASKKYQFAVKKTAAKTVDPLDTEYKTLRNDKAKLALAKAQKETTPKESDGWGAWTTKQVKDPSDPLGRREKTVSVRVNKKTGEREQKD